jgi:hypothetical protein
MVLNNLDPSAQDRAQVAVPDLSVESAWAVPCRTSQSEPVPSMGEEVSVMFERGDSEWPVWLSNAAAQGCGAGGGLGLYRATVLDNADPNQANRVSVSVPDLAGSEPVWVTPSSAVATPVPDIGSVVWVQFEGGDVNHGVWVGRP